MNIHPIVILLAETVPEKLAEEIVIILRKINDFDRIPLLRKALLQKLNLRSLARAIRAVNNDEFAVLHIYPL